RSPDRIRPDGLTVNDGLIKEQDILNCLRAIRSGLSFYPREIREHRHDTFCILFYFWQKCWKFVRNKHRFEAALNQTKQAREEVRNGNYQPTLALIREVTVLFDELDLRKKFEEVLFVDMIGLEKRLDQAVAQLESPIPT
ncbi:MAG: hypothetical protein HYV55_00885, partial [Parcubacteria group bacterium]|nr:hypothetical protein [Parcubacteria group bacterium]